jgi:signal transduction histidine kinase
LISAADTGAAPERILALYRGQLPIVARQLESTLARLRAPALVAVHPVVCVVWWSAAQARWSTEGVEFATLTLDDAEVDATLYDTVLDNLLRNALDKRQARGVGENVRVRTGLQAEGTRTILWVEDDGEAVPEIIVRDLFERPVVSRTGFGLGLYQLSRLARTRHSTLVLAVNQSGRVRFELRQERSRAGFDYRFGP